MAQSVLQKIEHLDAKADHQQITHIVTSYEFPFLMQKAFEFALFRTYAVPSIGALLDKTGHFVSAGQKRYDDTALLIAEWVENGYDSERGLAALRRMNQMHHHWEIANDDYLYVLSCFIFVPKYWYDMYGTRALTPKEYHAFYYFWVEVGKRMGMKDIPKTYEVFEQFFHDYERKHFKYNESSRRIADATINLFLSWYPSFARPMVLQGIYTLMDDPLRETFGYPAPPSWFKAMTLTGMKAAALVVRLLPPRSKPYLRTTDRNRTYPNGYEIDKIGPTEPIAKQ